MGGVLGHFEAIAKGFSAALGRGPCLRPGSNPNTMMRTRSFCLRNFPLNWRDGSLVRDRRLGASRWERPQEPRLRVLAGIVLEVAKGEG